MGTNPDDLPRYILTDSTDMTPDPERMPYSSYTFEYPPGTYQKFYTYRTQFYPNEVIQESSAPSSSTELLTYTHIDYSLKRIEEANKLICKMLYEYFYQQIQLKDFDMDLALDESIEEPDWVKQARIHATTIYPNLDKASPEEYVKIYELYTVALKPEGSE